MDNAGERGFTDISWEKWARKLEGWRAGKLESWRAGELESWRAGELESWKAGELESWKLEVGELVAGKLESWRLETPGQDERIFLVEQEQAGETQAVVAGCVFITGNHSHFKA